MKLPKKMLKCLQVNDTIKNLNMENREKFLNKNMLHVLQKEPLKKILGGSGQPGGGLHVVVRGQGPL